MKNFLAILFFLISTSSFSQTNELGLTLGATNFIGDLNTSVGAKAAKPAVGLFFRNHYHKHFALKASFLYGNLKGSDVDNPSYSYSQSREKGRGLSFSSHIWEISVVNEIYLLDKNHQNEFSAYVFGGGGIMHFNPTATYNGVKYNLRDYHTEGEGMPGYNKQYALTTLTGLLGLGGKYQFSPDLCLGLELGYRFTHSDYIDDVHGNYADPGIFQDNPTANALSDRSFEALVKSDPTYQSTKVYYDSYGNPHVNGYGSSTDKRGSNKTNDRYMVLNLSISYIFKNKITHGFSQSHL
jgi:hypothetical protein